MTNSASTKMIDQIISGQDNHILGLLANDRSNFTVMSSVAENPKPDPVVIMEKLKLDPSVYDMEEIKAEIASRRLEIKEEKREEVRWVPKWKTVEYLSEEEFKQFPISYDRTMDMESRICADGRKKIAIGIGDEYYININSKEDLEYLIGKLRELGKVFD